MPFKELRALVSRAGLSAEGVVEAAELRQLARDAAAILRARGGGSGAHAAERNGGAGAQPRADDASYTARARAALDAELAAHAAAVAEAHAALADGDAGGYANGGFGGGGADGSYHGRVRRAPIPTERDLLRQEQDREYQESLALDRAREESAAEAASREAAEAAQLAAAEAESEAQRARAAEQAAAELSARRAALPPEPAAGAPATVQVLARMPDGGRQTRRFAHTHRVSHLYDWVTVLWADASGPETVPPFVLVSNMPRKEHTERALSLADAGLGERQCALFVEPREAS